MGPPADAPRARRTYFGFAENLDEEDVALPAHGGVMDLQSDGDLEHLLNKLEGQWLVVEFSAERSATCLAMKPAFEGLAKERPDLAFARVDVDGMPATAVKNAATRVPSYLFLWDGVPEAEFAGASERKLRDTLQDCMQLGPSEVVRCQECGKEMHGTKLRKHIHPELGDCPRAQRECPHEGCSATFAREDEKRHLSTCEHKVVSCPHKGCEYVAKKRDMKEHAQGCNHRLVECTNECGALVKASELEEHVLTCRAAGF